MVQFKVPQLGESIREVQINQWLKKEGEWVAQDEDLVEIETEKSAQPLPSPVAGIVRKIMFKNGEIASVGSVIAELDESGTPAAAPEAKAATPVSLFPDAPAEKSEKVSFVMPAAERAMHEYKIAEDKVSPTGPGGRLLKEDVMRMIEQHGLATPKPAPQAAPPTQFKVDKGTVAPVATTGSSDRREEVKPMSMIRRTIAARLVQAQHNAALLTTFNEIDMLPVMDLRNRYKDKFSEIHGVKLGFNSFFVKAIVEGLKRFPALNAEIRGTDVIYRHYHDIGVAIGGGKGLVVPVMRNVEKMSFAEIERKIGEFAIAAKENKIKPSDLEGGTFSITNGGVFGSLLSTPIVNPPQSGILGMHAIKERPVAINGQVVVRPMMYVALTYDHRIVDGREAVGFLVCVKEVLEEPARLFLEV